MTHPNPEWVTTILVTYLEGNTPGLDVGLGSAPENPNPAYPYLVVTPLSPFLVEGGLNDGNSIQTVEWQVTSVGLTAQQAMGGIAAVRDRLLGTPGPDFTPASYKKTGEVKLSAGPALESELADHPPLFLQYETYRMTLVPA